MSRSSENDIPPVGLVIILIVCFFGAMLFHHALDVDCQNKGGQLKSVHHKTWVCVTPDGKIIE